MGEGERGRPEVAGIAESSSVLDAVTALDPAVRAGEAAAAAAVAAERSVVPASPPTDLTAAAFFDVDNTMMVGASIFHFARGLAARKFFTTSDMVGFVWQQVKFRIGGPRAQLRPHHRARHRAVVRRGASGRRDRRARRGDLRRADGGPDLGGHARAGPDAPRRRAAGLAGHGHTRGAGADHRAAAGADRGARHGRRERGRASTPAGWSGRSCTARRRRTRCARWPSTEGLNLRRCTAYSDSVNDVPMLSAVGTAVAVNPDRDLRDIARARGWQIRDFRTGRSAPRDRRAGGARRGRGGGRGGRGPAPLAVGPAEPGL